MEKENRSPSLEEYIQFWKDKIQKKKHALEERKGLLKGYAQLCSNLLKKEFNVKEVYLIGSIARDFKIHDRSDIDLVVVGLQDKDYFKALNRVYELLPQGVNIDLITRETASESLKKIIKKEGLIL